MLYKQINKKLVPVYAGEDITDAYRYERLAVNLPETPTDGYKFIQDGYEVIESDYWTEKWIQVECEEQALLCDKMNSFKTFIDNSDVIAKIENSNIRDFNSLLFQLAQYLNVAVTDLSFATENYKNKLLLQIAEAVGISLTSPSVVDINSIDNLILSIGEKMNYNNLPSNLQNYTTNQKRELVKRFFEELNPLIKTRKPLCFTAEEAGSTIKMVKTSSSAPTVYLETSPTSKEGSWSDFIIHTSSTSTDGTTITLANVGDKVYFRAKQDNQRFAIGSNDLNKFIMTGKIAASGNINTLLKADGSVLDLTGRDWCYCYMFQGCTALTQAPELPATTLAYCCYYWMFNNCTSLKQAPKLPAMILADICYESMFSACTSLTQAPKLPATTLTERCYTSMFSGCRNLIQAPELPATTLAYCCYRWMFEDCLSLTQPPALPATTLAFDCYYGMFYNCQSLTQAPELPATILCSDCYSGMFYNCSKLNSININFSNWNVYSEPTSNWVTGVASSGTFTCPTALPENRGTSNIPEGWTVVRK